jgi:hypothetical protein
MTRTSSGLGVAAPPVPHPQSTGLVEATLETVR